MQLPKTPTYSTSCLDPEVALLITAFRRKKAPSRNHSWMLRVHENEAWRCLQHCESVAALPHRFFIYITLAISQGCFILSEDFKSVS